jgi:hypothetical protein
MGRPLLITFYSSGDTNVALILNSPKLLRYFRAKKKVPFTQTLWPFVVLLPLYFWGAISYNLDWIISLEF